MIYPADLSKIANAYYNRGLERAQLQDLSGAAIYLKQSLRFDKYCTNARNLLGLIFFEMGETAAALVQWVISLNLDPENNAADRYLDEIQRKPAVLSNAASTIKRFNQALFLAQNGQEDFAVIELRDIAAKNPKYVKAQLLLSILYMQNSDNVKAGRALMEVLKVDRNNPQALVLMDEVKKRTGRADIEKSRLENAFSHRQMEDDDVILPKARKQATAEQILLYVIAGIAVGLLSFYLLILPTIRKGYRDELNRHIMNNSQELSAVNADYTKPKESYDHLQVEYLDVSQKLTAYEEENAAFTSMYEALNGIIDDFNSGDLLGAVNSYLEIDREKASQEPLLSQLQEVDRLIINDGFNTIVNNGTLEWNAGNMEQAEYYYTLALKIKGDDPEAMYLLARLLQNEDRVAEANALFDRIVGEHPESRYAQRAIEARGY